MRSQQVLPSVHLVSSSFGQRPRSRQSMMNTLVLKPPPGMNLAALWHQQSSVLPQTRSLTSQGDMSHHQDIYDNPSLTKKVFANMKRVGTGFSGVITPLFENMLVLAAEEVELMDLCTILSNKVLDLESEVTDSKSSFIDKIEKLEDRVHKLEEENKIHKETSFKFAKIDTAAPDIDEEEPAEVEELLEVVTAAKLITEVVNTAEPTTIAAQVPKASDPRRRRVLSFKILRRQQHQSLCTQRIFSSSIKEPKNFSYDFLQNILKIMFEKPVIEANVWKDQKGKYGLAKKYPLTHFTLEQMLNNIRLEVKKESEMSLELLRLSDLEENRILYFDDFPNNGYDPIDVLTLCARFAKLRDIAEAVLVRSGLPLDDNFSFPILGEEIMLNLFPLAPWPYYMDYPYANGKRNSSPRALDHTITYAELARTEAMSPLELSTWMSVLTSLIVSHDAERNVWYTSLASSTVILQEKVKFKMDQLDKLWSEFYDLKGNYEKAQKECPGCDRENKELQASNYALFVEGTRLKDQKISMLRPRLLLLGSMARMLDPSEGVRKALPEHLFSHSTL
nr:hypothetical protein [Tanacetum cinerariifolium]